MRALRRFAVSLTVLLCASSAHALDHTIPAAKLRLKRSASGKESLVLLSKQPAFPVEDPSVVGATVELFSGSGGHATFAIPPGLGTPGWKVNGLVQLFLYRNGKSSTVTRIRRRVARSRVVSPSSSACISPSPLLRWTLMPLRDAFSISQAMR